MALIKWTRNENGFMYLFDKLSFDDFKKILEL